MAVEDTLPLLWDEVIMTINLEIFCSVLAALFAYSLIKHVIGVVLGRLWGQPLVAASHPVGRKAAN